MKTLSLTVLGIALVASFAVAQKPQTSLVGQDAPKFSMPAADGKTYDLSAYKGKYVVLEWTNKDCPFVKKHYGSGSMQATQKAAIEMGAVWLSIISSSPGSQGYLTADEVTSYRKDRGVNSTATLLDPEGKLGHMYNARTTPQIVIINPDGKVIYNGAIDNRPTPDPSSLEGATNYCLQALKEAMAGKAVSVPTSKPYGCSVKYAE